MQSFQRLPRFREQPPLTADAYCLRIQVLEPLGEQFRKRITSRWQIFRGQTEWIRFVWCHVVEGLTMQKHAMALGYFFLAVFCVFTNAHCILGLHLPLLWAALAAAVAGVGYLLSACAVTLQAGKTRLSHWFVRMFHLAQQPPIRESSLRDEPGV